MTKSSTAPKRLERKIEDLKPADYNPRTISASQKKALHRSYLRYGDLSGVVLNKTTGRLVGGTQRVDLYRNAKGAKVFVQPYRDATGTVAMGYVTLPSKRGIIRMPYREVRWDADTESAARIAANASGGKFDQHKLGKVLKRLERRKYPVEDTLLEPIEIQKAVFKFENANQGAGAFDVDIDENKSGSRRKCPRCGFKFNA